MALCDQVTTIHRCCCCCTQRILHLGRHLRLLPLPLTQPSSRRLSPAALRPPPRRRPPHPRASVSGVGTSEEDAFTRSSGYLFKDGLSAEGELPMVYDINGIAAVYRRRLLLMVRRSLQIGASFGRWFALRYLDSVNERTDDMFEIRAFQLRRILLELGPAFVKIAQAVSSRPVRLRASDPTAAAWAILRDARHQQRSSPVPVISVRDSKRPGPDRPQQARVLCGS